MSTDRVGQPAELTAYRWLHYGKRRAKHPSLWDSSLAFASGPLLPEGDVLRDYSGRTAGATWSVGAGDSTASKYTKQAYGGRSFYGAAFDGINDVAATPAYTTPNSQNMSVSWWNSTGGGTCGIIDRNSGGSATSTDWCIWQSSYFVKVFVNDASTFQTIQDSIRQADYSPRWWSYSFVLDSSALRLWRNGVQNTPVARTIGQPKSVSEQLLLGAYRTDGIGPFNGSLCAVMVHARELTSEEVLLLSQHPLAAFETVVPRYWIYGTSIPPASAKPSLWMGVCA